MKKIILATAVLLSSTAALANTAGTHVINGGILHFNPANDESDIMATFNGTSGATGSSATVDSTNTLGLGYDYFVTDNIAVGVQLGLPPKFDVVSKKSTHGLSAGTVIGEVEQISPELKAKYVFGTPDQKFRPFIGGGLAYVMFKGEITHPAIIADLGTEVDVDSKIAPVISVGGNYQVNERYSIGGSVSYVKLETDMTFPNQTITHPVAGISASDAFAEANVNPVVLYFNADYAFR
jgi:outer membrane protein